MHTKERIEGKPKPSGDLSARQAPQRPRPAGRPEPVGRYSSESLRRARTPANGLASPRRPPNSIVIAAVPDPMPDKPGDRVLASVNRRVDVLEHERSHGHIGEQAFATGREFQRLHEKVDALPSSNWEGRNHVDAAAAHEEAITRRHLAVHRIKRYRRRAVERIGLFGWWFLRRAIVEGVSFARLGADNGYANDKGREWAARTFRRLLEEMSLAVGTTGAPDRKRRGEGVDPPG